MEVAPVTLTQNGLQPYQSSNEHLLAGLAYAETRVRWAIDRAQAEGLLSDDKFRGLYLTEDLIEQVLLQPIGMAGWNGRSPHNNRHQQWQQNIQSAYAQWQQCRQLTADDIFFRLEWVQQCFDLLTTELDILLLTLAPELDRRFERLYAYLQDDVTQQRPTVDLLLNLLTESVAEKMELRGLFLANGRLLSHRLIHLYQDGPRSEHSFTAQFVRPSTTILNYLLGHTQISPQIKESARLTTTDDFTPRPWFKGPFWQQIVEASEKQPCFSFVGKYGMGRREAALSIAHARQQPLLEVNLVRLAKLEEGVDEGLGMVMRDGRLHKAILYITRWDTVLNENLHPKTAVLDKLLTYNDLVIVAGQKRWQPRAHQHQRPIYTVPFPHLEYVDRLRIWQHYLGDQPNIELSTLANHFQFTPGQVEDAVLTARDMAEWQGETLQTIHLLKASRAHSNQKLADLATKAKSRHNWDDLILPPDPLAQLHEIVNQARNRPTVHDKWGFGSKLLGRGISALFTGEPGTGKTMSSGIISGELGLDLYKVDLSALVSKYIGETEKNLDRVFTEANTSNAVLFFDEADSIFGKRSEVKDSHDRYANLEISYLLQRIEAYDGIAILATNMRANLDEAFTRRFDFITDFPFPDAEYREAIWRIHFPPQLPLADDIDLPLLARRFRLAGGNIRKIILAAAFLAARDNEATLSMHYILHAARREYQKMGRLIEESLFEEQT